MARLLTLMAIAICGALFASAPALAQSDQDSRCFPWQELRDGACVAKPSRGRPPANPASSRRRRATSRRRPQHRLRRLAARCRGACRSAAPPLLPRQRRRLPPPVAAVPVAAAPTAILCDGGTASGSTCNCPGGYTLLPATSGSGGTCVRSNADNCRGGVLTVSGICLCDGRVTMSGETYALEFLGGKCVPKRCPDQSYLRDGKCVASNDTRFSFTCRTGYVPDDSHREHGDRLACTACRIRPSARRMPSGRMARARRLPRSALTASRVAAPAAPTPTG